ncbi:MAG: pseudouridine synthase [Acidobacteriota bacterium]
MPVLPLSSAAPEVAPSVDAPAAASLDQASEPAVAWQDDCLVVVAKPTGWIVHRGWARDATTVADWLRARLDAPVHALHRLDRGTSGALVFARDAETARRVRTQFEAGTVDKRYLALVRGHPPDVGEIDHPVPRKRGRDERVPAVTRYRRLATCALDGFDARARYALVEAMPVTGRLHQIRRHFKHISHPLIGDVRYGKGEHNRRLRGHVGLHRLALHAQAIAFDHPTTGARTRVDVPVPDDLAEPLRRLDLWPVAVDPEATTP